jgi:MoaA/NifB/PqqE/SkfB family radical SAM enzyme
METKRKLNFIKNIFNKDFQTLIFFVTSVCNSRCVGCFNWKNLNKKNDLSLEEIEKISLKMPCFKHILFSGGEPTLRKDLAEICKIFVKNNCINSISIPTNGLLPEKIYNVVKDVAEKNPSLGIGIHFSLDGMEKTHDYLRGVPGNFKKVQESVKKILELRKYFPQIEISVNTVISDKNYLELPELIEFVKKLGVNSHTFDLLRGEVKDGKVIGLPALEEIKRLNKLRIETRKYYLRNEGFVHRMFSMMKEYYLIKSQMRVLRGLKLNFKCLGGNVGAVMTADGKVGLCELLGNVGDLRKENYDFMKIWKGKLAQHQRKLIKEHKCDCTHTCFLSMSIDHYANIIFWKMPWYYFLG